MRYARARLGMHFGTVLAVLYPSIYKYVNMIHLKQDSLWVIKIYRRESFGRQKERRKKKRKGNKAREAMITSAEVYNFTKKFN